MTHRDVDVETSWGRYQDPEDIDLFAEASPERVVVEEEYHYAQEISENRWTERAGPPSGRVEISVPYDGARHLPRSTADTLARRLRGSSGNATATIGHLVLTDHQHTDIAEVLPLDDGHGAIPVRIPVRSEALPDADALTADRHEYRWALDYAPNHDRPKLYPVELVAVIEDSDTSGLTDIISEFSGQTVPPSFVDGMTKQVAFNPALTLVLTATVTVSLPHHRTIRAPRVRRISVEIPAMSSLGGGKLRLSVDDQEHLVHYDAARRCVEWFDVPTSASFRDDDTSSTSSTRITRITFRSPDMRLDIDEPGELFDREEVVVRVEVELPDLLLSGMHARLFDARGRRAPGRQVPAPHRTAPTPGPAAPQQTSAFVRKPTTRDEDGGKPAPPRQRPRPRWTDPVMQRTIVRSRCIVSLRDAFARRWFRPHQSLHFDEIIPTQERVADVDSILCSLGFTSETKRLDEGGAKQDELLWIVWGWRGGQVSGKGASVIWIVIRGRRHKTRRQSERVVGTTYTTTMETGEIELFVRGLTPGDHTTLMEHMNDLHRKLKERFRPMRSQK